MKRKTLLQVGLTTLLSCSAHAALMPMFQSEAPTAKVQGGIVSVRLTSGRPSTEQETKVEKVSEVRKTDPVEPVQEVQKEQIIEEKPERKKLAETGIVPTKKALEKPEPVPTPTPSPTTSPTPSPTPAPTPTPLPSPSPKAHENSELIQQDDVQKEKDTTTRTAKSEAERDHTTTEKAGTESSEASSETETDAQSVIETDQATASTAGNAADSNYAGLVMKHLSRVRRPRASSPGSAFVKFTLGPHGELEALDISESSGSGRFDRDALRVVEKAAPYPEPPIGVNRTFVVEIKGR